MMRPKRDRSWRGGHDQSTLRRPVLEAALVKERIWLWADFETAFHVGDEDQMIFLAHRIRVIGEALGYPSEVATVPVLMLKHMEIVETAPELGLTARWWNRDEVSVEPEPVARHMRWPLHHHPDPDELGDPDE